MCNEADLGERLTLTGQGGGRQRRRVGGMESLQPGPLTSSAAWALEPTVKAAPRPSMIASAIVRILLAIGDGCGCCRIVLAMSSVSIPWMSGFVLG